MKRTSRFRKSQPVRIKNTLKNKFGEIALLEDDPYGMKLKEFCQKLLGKKDAS